MATISAPSADSQAAFDKVVPRLNNVKAPNAKGWSRAECPAHDDESRDSLGFIPDNKLGVRFNCFAGCKRDAIIAALGLTKDDLRPPGTERPRSLKIKGVETRYEYIEANGKLAATKVREDFPGTDRAKQPWWLGVLNGRLESALPLYNLPALLAAPTDAPVAFVEGEKVVEALKSIGVLAVSGSGGAGVTMGPESLQPLLGHPVVFAPDNDEAGEDYAARHGRRLRGMGHRDTYRAPIPEGKPPKWDLADAVADGEDVRELLKADRFDPDAAELAPLLDATVAYQTKYAVVGQNEAVACALFVAHTYAIDAAYYSPLIIIDSPQPETGKTRLGAELLGDLVLNPQAQYQLSSAALVRILDSGRVTLLIDELDKLLRSDKEKAAALLGAINAGVQRGRASYYTIVEKVGNNYVTRKFCVFGPKVLVGIMSRLKGALDDTTISRSIRIRMKKKLPTETIARYRPTLPDVRETSERIRNGFATWSDEAIPRLQASWPPLPNELGDRQQDIWEPLLQIADMAGEAWGERARRAAVALSISRDADDESLGLRLLRDIYEVFCDRNDDGEVVGLKEFMWTRDLLPALVGLDESPWGDLPGGKPLTAQRMHPLMREFDIKPKLIKAPQGQWRGYRREQLEDVWARYCSIRSVPSVPADNGALQEGTEPVSPDELRTPAEQATASGDGGDGANSEEQGSKLDDEQDNIFSPF